MWTSSIVRYGLLAKLTLSGCAGIRSVPRVEPDPAPLVRRVADGVIRDFPQPPPFDWGEGTLMAGMMQAARATGDKRYVAFVRRWADHWRQHGLEAILAEKGYCGHWGPGFPLLMLHETTGERTYLELAGLIVTFMQDQATRTSQGGLGHWRDNRQLWVDTLYMSTPVYANYGRLTGRPELVEEAGRQLAISAAHLQDQTTGLFYHMYDEPSDTRTREPWARGNGWTAMSYVETLRYLGRDSGQYADRLAEFRRLVAGLKATWDAENHLWHTILTSPQSYLETSGSAMILFSLLEGSRLGIIEPPAPELLGGAWRALGRQIDDAGRVIGVSAGTGPGTFAEYNRVPLGTYTWGTGAFLLAGSALLGG